MVEAVDTADLKSAALRRMGSSPIMPTIPIYTPYVGGMLNSITAAQCDKYDWEPIMVSGDHGYAHYMRQRWKSLKSFINVEQDVIVWPGAIEEIWTCPMPWCGYSYSYAAHDNLSILGCTKISTQVMLLTENLWLEDSYQNTWDKCDGWLKGAIGHGMHVHWPYVINANTRYYSF